MDVRGNTFCPLHFQHHYKYDYSAVLCLNGRITEDSCTETERTGLLDYFPLDEHDEDG